MVVEKEWDTQGDSRAQAWITDEAGAEIGKSGEDPELGEDVGRDLLSLSVSRRCK